MVRLVVAVLAVLTATCLADHHFNEKYPFSLTLDNDNYYLYWNFSLADETIQFGVRAKTEGWVGFGISPNGQMPGSDVVIGWVDGDEAYFHVSQTCQAGGTPHSCNQHSVVHCTAHSRRSSSKLKQKSYTT